jgi:hypothetical protein
MAGSRYCWKSRHSRSAHAMKLPGMMKHGLSWSLPLALFVQVLLPSIGAEMKDESWAQKWCELNDCYGVKERAKAQTAMEKMDSEHRKVTRR